MSMSNRIEAQVAGLAGKTVLVVGDVILDEYIIGKPTRMSREAPVPVLELESRRYIAGGSANPAANIVAFGSRAFQAGVIGEDDAGARLVQILKEQGIDASGLIRRADRPTTVKTRILAQMGLRFPQQVTRIDTLTRRDIDSETEARILAFAESRLEQLDGVLLSHYHGGLLTPALVRRVRELCRGAGILITADVQGKFGAFSGLDVIKCNADDAERYLNRDLASDDDFGRAALELASALLAERAAIITRGSRGATVASAGEIQHCPAPSVSDVYDTVGAGDTAIATATLAMASGYSAVDAVTLANSASGIVVRHLGNYAPTPAELTRSLQDAL